MIGPKFTRRQAIALTAGTVASTAIPGAAWAGQQRAVPDLEPAGYDPFTGLPNEQMFIDRIRELEALKVPTYLGLTVAVIDIASYQRLRHEPDGDVKAKLAALTTANRLKRHQRNHWEMIARLRDDQFGLLLTTDDDFSLKYELYTTRRALSLPFRAYRRERLLAPHIGAMRKRAHVHLAPDLIAMARQAAVNARREGRDEPLFYDAGIVG